MLDREVESVASEPASARRQRAFLEDRAKKLEQGRDIFQVVMGSVTI